MTMTYKPDYSGDDVPHLDEDPTGSYTMAARLLQLINRPPDDIARGLRLMGVTGFRGNAYRCPIYEYLRRHGVPVKLVEFDGALISYSPKYAREVTLPPNVVAFMDAFDEGAYPELVPNQPAIGGTSNDTK